MSLSSVPVVGCRNQAYIDASEIAESIKRSGGGVSELIWQSAVSPSRVYQAFRWWGVGTKTDACQNKTPSLSSVPVVGCRNRRPEEASRPRESIKRSGGGVSEHVGERINLKVRVYQAFRWWGVGTGSDGVR